MVFVPGRRRKKQATSRRDNSNHVELDDLEWVDGSDENDAVLKQKSSDVPSFAVQDGRGVGKKRKCYVEPDKSVSSPSPSSADAHKIGFRVNTSIPNLLYLREIGAFGSRAYSYDTTTSGKPIRKTLRSLLLCKPSPSPSAHNENDSTADVRDSRWVDQSPPIYNIQYFHNNTESTTLLRKDIWRKKQIIPFSKLKTPVMDAILGIDRSGGFLIGVGGSDPSIRRDLPASAHVPKLVLKVYGVPSPHRLHQLEQNNAERHLISPRIHTVPLLLNTDESNQERYIIDRNPYSSPAAENPLQILLSDDGTIGVAFIRNATVSCAWTRRNESIQDDEVLGTVVVFEMPLGINRSNGLTRSYRSCNVRIGGWNSYTMRNALWKTTLVPTCCGGFRKALSAYILFNDEDDGFRISWIASSFGIKDLTPTEIHFQPGAIRPSRTDILSKPEDDAWEKIVTDTTNCQSYASHKVDGSDLEIAFELYLSVDALLSDILDRRKHSSMFGHSAYQSNNVRFIPEFYYNLVSAEASRMEVTLVLVFSNREKMMHDTKRMPSVMGVFVKLSLYDQSYDELQWVCYNDTRSMKSWCESLALNWRMKETAVGIFCTDSAISGASPNWLCNTHDHNCDEDLEDDKNEVLWNEYAEKRVNAAKKSQVVAPKAISMTSLFQNCDTVSNRAVQTAVPLTRMTSRCSPIEVVYG